MQDFIKIKSFFKKNQRFPSYEEMKLLFKIKSKNTVFYRVTKLINQGLLKKKGRYLYIPEIKIKDN